MYVQFRCHTDVSKNNDADFEVYREILNEEINRLTACSMETLKAMIYTQKYLK